jgi:predicted RNase H-like nuclease
VNEFFCGVDGCHSGWVVVQLDDHHKWDTAIVTDNEALAAWVVKSKLTLIDIPIGLPDSAGSQRVCDQLARRALGMPRAASVFPVPSRSAVYAQSYQDACILNHQRLGKKLSKQSWNIAVKIKMIDQLVRTHNSRLRKLRESHPEICFWALDHKTPMRFNKKKSAGREERMALLMGYMPQAKKIVDRAMEKYPRKDLAADDIVDAIVLAVTAKLVGQNFATFPVNPPKDQYNIRMEIIYPLVDDC